MHGHRLQVACMTRCTLASWQMRQAITHIHRGTSARGMVGKHAA